MLNQLLCLIYPRRCACCNKVINPNLLICDDCESEIMTTKNDFCNNCGDTKKRCSCKNRVYFYDKIYIPMYNCGPAKTGIYNLKFQSRVDSAVYFAREIVNCIPQNQLSEIDVVTAVPMSKRKRKERRFNQSERIAIEISKIAKLPYDKQMLVKTKENKIQHTLKFNERIQNVTGAYSAKRQEFVKTVLLVDDIKTSGATLNECSKQLKLCGVDKVVAVAGVATVFGKS